MVHEAFEEDVQFRPYLGLVHCVHVVYYLYMHPCHPRAQSQGHGNFPTEYQK